MMLNTAEEFVDRRLGYGALTPRVVLQSEDGDQEEKKRSWGVTDEEEGLLVCSGCGVTIRGKCRAIIQQENTPTPQLPVVYIAEKESEYFQEERTWKLEIPQETAKGSHGHFVKWIPHQETLHESH
ncbi:hypothetical protein SK128_019520 [Halocaridina rubra]|uniref:Uncharacterized protein n=1 Tax=Halocaridina rubra TaxID=373956 RepID=A0AAN8XG64_HALRR